MKVFESTRPAAIAVFCYLAILGISFAQQSAPLPREGRLVRLAIDSVDPADKSWKGRTVPAFNAPNGEIHLIDDPDAVLARVPDGERIQVNGTSGPGGFAARDVKRIGLEPAPVRSISEGGNSRTAVQAEYLGRQRTLVALLSFSDSVSWPVTLDQMKAAVIDSPQSVDRFIRENSTGKTWLEAEFSDWNTMPYSIESVRFSDANLINAVLNFMYRAADLSNYDRLICIVPGEGKLSFAGLGSLGKVTAYSSQGVVFQLSVSIIDADYALAGVIAHEFGHNLGLRHASNIACIPESFLDPLVCGPLLEYGDAGDAMGDAWSYQPFSTANKTALQWLEPSQILDVPASGEYVLDQSESGAKGIKALRIHAGKDLSGADITYWVEYRAPAGEFSRDTAVQVRLKQGYFLGWNGSSGSQRPLDRVAGNWISGRVTRAADGAALEDVTIEVYDTSWNLARSSQTDARGRYAVGGLADGRYYLRTHGTGGFIDRYYPNTTSRDASVSLAVAHGGEITNIDFALTPGGTVSGHVVNHSDGTGISAVYLTVVDSGGSGSWSASTDSAGNYAVKGLPHGDFYVRTSNSRGFLDQYFDGASDFDKAALVHVDEGKETGNVNFALRLGGTISGRVARRSDNTGISSATVIAYTTDHGWGSVSSTDSSGAYTLIGLPTGSYTVQATSFENYITAYYNNASTPDTANAVAVAEGAVTGNIDFLLETGGLITGRVTRESDGSALANVYVQVYSSDWGYERSGYADSSGRFVVNGLRDGTYYAWTYNSQGYLDEYYNNASSRASAAPISVKAGAETPDVGFALVLGGTISGHVVQRRGGAAIPGVWISVSDQPLSLLKSSVTDSEGAYRVIGLGPGAYLVSTSNNKGFVDEYYLATVDRSEASPVPVALGLDTGGIDFALSEARASDQGAPSGPSSSSAVPSGRARGGAVPGDAAAAIAPAGRPFSTKPGVMPERTALPGSDSCCGRIDYPSAASGFADATLSTPFRDPYRGIRIDLLEKLGAGDEAQARIRVTLPEMSARLGEVIDLGEHQVGAGSTSELSVSNRSSKDLSVGQLSIRGRHGANFSLAADGCSNSSIKPGQSCSVTVQFAVSNAYPSPISGEFGILAMPLSDSLFDVATVDLFALGSFLDLAVSKSHSGGFSVGRNAGYDISVKNRGTVVASGPITVTDILPAGLRFLSSTGDWNCSATGQDVTCTHVSPIYPGGVLHLGISAAVDPAAAPSCTNTVTLSASGDPFPENNSARDTAAVALESAAAAADYPDFAEPILFNPRDESLNLCLFDTFFKRQPPKTGFCRPGTGHICEPRECSNRAS